MRKDEKAADEKQQRIDERTDEKKQADEILRAALEYGAKGYRVFPVCCGQKDSNGEDSWKAPARWRRKWIKWKEEATTDIEKIREWFGGEELYNIGLVCDGLIVIDLDTNKDGKKESGFKGIDVLSKRLGSLPSGPQAVTSTGGQHLFFKRPSDSKLANVNGHTIDGTKYGIDVKTESVDNKGELKLGYVVAAPSIGANGEP